MLITQYVSDECTIIAPPVVQVLVANHSDGPHDVIMAQNTFFVITNQRLQIYNVIKYVIITCG